MQNIFPSVPGQFVPSRRSMGFPRNQTPQSQPEYGNTMGFSGFQIPQPVPQSPSQFLPDCHNDMDFQGNQILQPSHDGSFNYPDPSIQLKEFNFMAIPENQINQPIQEYQHGSFDLTDLSQNQINQPSQEYQPGPLSNMGFSEDQISQPMPLGGGFMAEPSISSFGWQPSPQETLEQRMMDTPDFPFFFDNDLPVFDNDSSNVDNDPSNFYNDSSMFDNSTASEHDSAISDEDSPPSSFNSNAEAAFFVGNHQPSSLDVSAQLPYFDNKAGCFSFGLHTPPDSPTHNDGFGGRSKRNTRKSLEKKHKCNVEGCNGAFNTEKDLRRHKPVHEKIEGADGKSSAVKGYRCNVVTCGKAKKRHVYNRRDNFTRHMTQQHKEITDDASFIPEAYAVL